MHTGTTFLIGSLIYLYINSLPHLVSRTLSDREGIQSDLSNGAALGIHDEKAMFKKCSPQIHEMHNQN